LDELIDLLLPNRAFGERDPQLLAQLVWIELLATAVLLDHYQTSKIDSFEGGKAARAFRAFATSPDGAPTGNLPAVSNAGIWRLAIGTFHPRASSRSSGSRSSGMA